MRRGARTVTSAPNTGGEEEMCCFGEEESSERVWADISPQEQGEIRAPQEEAEEEEEHH